MSQPPYELILLRHGESTWNLANRFTGWVDVPLTERGFREARAAAALLRQRDALPDVVHTSVLTRAIQTAHAVLEELGLLWIDVRRHWRLNERMYGGLQGLNKAETAKRFGPDQVRRWRRGYRDRPPSLPATDPQHPSRDRRYAHLAPDVLPSTESLEDVLARVLPYWYDVLVPDLRAGKRVLVVAHGNSLRALVKHLERISAESVEQLELPTGSPRFYALDGALQPLRATERSATGEPPAPAPYELDVVDEADYESFPASDPPCWTLGR